MRRSRKGRGLTREGRLPSSDIWGAPRDTRISARPFIIMRWLGIAGQIAAIIIASAGFGVALPVWFMMACIAPSVILNLFMTYRFLDRPIGNHVVLATLAYDTVQIAGLLYFAGGIDNPFCIFLVAPMAVGASILPLRNIVALVVLPVACIAALSVHYHPLDWPEPKPALSAHFALAQGVSILIMLIFIGFIMWVVSNERQRILAAYEEAQQMLIRHRALSAIGAITTASIHELGSPLSTIALIAGDMEREIYPDDPLADDVRLLVQESRKCKDILGRLGRHYDESRTALSGEGQRPARLRRAAHIMRAIAARLRHEKPHVSVDIRDETDGATLSESYENIQIFENVMSNAVDHAATRVTVRIATVRDEERQMIEVVVRDDGAGFAPDIIAKIGEPYASTRAGQGGSHHMGLGLFITSIFLDRCGGRMNAQNGPEGGASVRIILPAADATGG